jgi:hypothetical protein
VFEERLARAANILPAFRPLKSLWGSGFAPLAFARSASPTFWLAYARQNVAGRDRYVQYELQEGKAFAARPGLRPSGADIQFPRNMKIEDEYSMMNIGR